MRRIMWHGVWMAAGMFWAVSVGALAQDPAPAKPAPPEMEAQPQGPGAEQMMKAQELDRRINRLLRETAQATPEIKALFDVQQSKWLDANKKRADIIAGTPEIKGLKDELDAKRKKERDVVSELAAKNPELAEMRRQYQELERKFNLKMQEIAASSPELLALHSEIAGLQAKFTSALQANAEIKRVNADLDMTSSMVLKKAAAASPELAKAIAERDALVKDTSPPAPEPKAIEPAK